MKKNIVIIGGGFAGLSALSRLALGKRYNITLIDERTEFNFLPALPDIIGERIDPRFLTLPLEVFARRKHAAFTQASVTGIDTARRAVLAGDKIFPYDYLLVATGSVTNFYGNNQLSKSAFTLDNIYDAKKILTALLENKFTTIIIAGGGYTGIEIATNIKRFFSRHALYDKQIVIIERSPAILSMLPDWMRHYASYHLKMLGITIYLNTVLARIENDTVFLNPDHAFLKAMVIWAAGVNVRGPVEMLDVAKNPQGRIFVDQYLRFLPNCFCAGDAAAFYHKGGILRMGVQFSITQGAIVADNIKRAMKGLPLKRFWPRDLGYIVPLADDCGCGKVLGINVKGKLASRLHYLMCAYRTFGFKHKLGVLQNVFSKRA